MDTRIRMAESLQCSAETVTMLLISYVMPAKSFQSCPTLSTLWTIACQAPLSMGILQARILQWVAMPSSRGSS